MHGRSTDPRLRTFRAFARAVLPGGALPAAGGEDGVDVAGPLLRFLEYLPPGGARLVHVAWGALEWSSFPHRFSRLDRARAAAHVERLERSRIAPLRDLVVALKLLTGVAYADHPRVRAAVGVRPRCELAGGGVPPRAVPSLEAAALVPASGVERCDVVIVGSGAGGAAAARVLAERGLDVIVVERGPYRDARDYPGNLVDVMGTLYRDGGMTVCEGRPAIPMPIGRCVGGTTVVNSGTCFRTPDDVLLGWREGSGIPWATALDEHFEALERDLRVTPVDPATAGRNAALCRAGAEELGVSHGPIARNAGPVSCCGTCPSGCALDAKQAMHVGELPRAVAAGARVRAGLRVAEVLVEHGRAVGVKAAVESPGDAGGSGAPAEREGRYEVRARAVVLAAGALGTPELLLGQGLANSSGAVGRHLRIHPACSVAAHFDDPVRGWDGVMQSWYVDQWSDRGLMLEATFTPLAFGLPTLAGAGARLEQRILDYDRLAMIGVQRADASEGRVTLRGGRARVTYRLGADDAQAIRFGIARACDIHFAAGAREVHPHIGRVTHLAQGEQTRRIEGAPLRPHELRLEAFHPLGSARMGGDARTSVVAPTGESHDLQGLYVADASVLPGSPRVNPMITIMAVARRIAAGLGERLGG